MSSHSLAFIIAALVVGTTSAIRVSVQAAPSLVRPPATPAPRALVMMQEEAPEAPLTWNTALDADGETYYWNSAGASTYEKPADFDPATAKAVTEKYQAKGGDDGALYDDMVPEDVQVVYKQTGQAKPQLSQTMKDKMIAESRGLGADPNQKNPFLGVFAGMGVFVVLGAIAINL